MLNTISLSLTHNLTHQQLVSHLSMSVNQGDKLAIIGEEGNGKSSLLKVLANIKPDYIDVEGSFNCDSIIGYLPQQIEFDGSVEDFFISKTHFQLEDYSLLDQVNLDSNILYSQQHFNTLSGGQKVKCYLLALLINQVDLFLLDEVSNDLDLNALVWLENFIKNSGKTFILISHDTTFLQNCANRFLLLEQTHRKTRPRHSFYSGKFNDFMKYRSSQLEHQDQIATQQRSLYKKKMDRYRQIRQKVDHAQSSISRQDPASGKNLKDKMHAIKSIGKRFDKEKENFLEFSNTEDPIDFFFTQSTLPKQKEIIRLIDFELPLKNSKQINNINLIVKGQDKVVIIGENGIGKTTLLKELIQQAQSLNLKLGIMSQNVKEQLLLDKTPIDYLKRNETKEELAKISSLLGSMKFTANEMNHTINNLSGGQQAKTLILKMMIDESQVLFLDEPTRNLSPLSLPVFISALQEFNGCIIAISHDRAFIKAIANYNYELTENGLSLVTHF